MTVSRLVSRFLGVLLLPLSACNSSGWQQALAPDPQLTAPPTESASPTASPTIAAPPSVPLDAGAYTDLDKAPPELRPYLVDLLQLDLLQITPDSPTFAPNQPVTRREYARWLVAVNNRFYADRPANQIRLGVETADLAFTDVSKTDPDFPAIQGLAEAGLIPSRLSGDATATQFRPDAPLSREDLILWKVPVDTRQALPTATIEAVEKTWGFQDASKISPKALRAILMDYQNGDQSNLRRAFGYTTLLQPQRATTRAEAAAVLWSLGFQADRLTAQEVLSGPKPTSSPKPAASLSPEGRSGGT
jgi:hypothetical protein